LLKAWQPRLFTAAMAGAIFVGGAAQTFGDAQPAGQSLGEAGTSRIVLDEAERRVRIPAEVRRIVTLAPNLTETVYALGLEDRLVGDTDYCDTPPAARMKTHVGAPVSPSLEAIVGLRPDLVLATTSINRRETVETLARLGIAVYTSDPHTVRGMLDSIARMADLAGAAPQGAALVGWLEARLDALHTRLADLPLVHVLFVVWEDPLITIGQNTFIADALRWAGAESVIVSSQNWPQVSMEEVVRLQPDYIVLASNHAETNASRVSDLRGRPAWNQLRAVEMGHVVVLSEEMARPSPGLIDSIEELARELHPQAFVAVPRPHISAVHARPLVSASVAAGKECRPCAR
jgi:iron complex transport system substrate-binding protein